MANDLADLSLLSLAHDLSPRSSLNPATGSMDKRNHGNAAGVWQLDFQFGYDGDNALFGATSVDMGADYVAVTDHNTCKVHLYSGVNVHPALRFRKTFNVPHRPWDVAVSPDGRCFVTDDGPVVNIFNSKGQYLSKLPISNPPYDNMTEVLSVRIDDKRRVLVGERVVTDVRGVVPATQDRISIYTLDGSLVKSFNIDIPPWHMAILPNGNIAVSPDCRDNVRIYDMNGSLQCRLPPPNGVSTMAWCPSGVCCSRQGEIFIGCREGEVGVYRYTSSGEYLGCITKDPHVPTVSVNIPRGMAMTKDGDTLLVADWASIKVFSRGRLV